MLKGYLALVLHAHLPFVRHPEHESFLEERWLYEAVTETYVPLLEVFQKLAADGVSYRLTVSLSPPLVSMLTDGLLQERYARHLEGLLELAEKEEHRTYGGPCHATALLYGRRLRRCRDLYYRYDRNLVRPFKELQDAGCLEIMTCAATHGYLPFMMLRPEAVRAQVETAVETHRQHFGVTPPGIWLPECAYTPGLDEILRQYGLKYFLTDTHGVLYASHRPRYGVFAPIYCPSGVAAFGRDPESSRQVWSMREGYPGDYEYREYYRDIGFDLDYDYVRPYIHPDGFRINTGFKYHRITGRDNFKDYYQPDRAREKAAVHAGNFLFNRQHQVRWLAGFMDRPVLLTAPYDAELFGHWWFEGPRWLDYLIRKLVCDQTEIELITPAAYLERQPLNQMTTPCASSWGNKGYHEVWLCAANDWVYRHLHIAGDRMVEMANERPRASGAVERALNQAGRELLLAQASDWAFIMSTGTMVPYAVRRTKEHLLNFQRLRQEIREDRVDEGHLAYLEGKNNIFPRFDYRCYRSDRAEVRHCRGPR